MRNGPVLTEDTAEIAVREENGPGPFSAYQTHFFAKMGVIAKNHRLNWSPTDSFFSFLSIHPTLSGTKLAIFE
jgi:hypothetical protein